MICVILVLSGYVASESKPCQQKFPSSDLAAIGAYRALRDHALRVREDMSVAGCNHIEGPCLRPKVGAAFWN